MLVFRSEALISDLIVAERAYAADRWGQPLTYDFGRHVAWLSFPRWKQHGLVGTRSRTRSRAIRRRMSQKGANSKQEKLMARASAPKEQERAAEAAKRSVETCSAGRAGAHPYRRRRSGSVLSFLRCIPTIQLLTRNEGLLVSPLFRTLLGQE